MKKILLYGMLLNLMLSACRKEGTELFWGNTNLDQRLADTLVARQHALVSASYGWTSIFSPKGGGSYLFYMKFYDNNRVDMVSDINVDVASKVTNSSYVFRVTGQPSLIFDTYSPLHILSHPQNATSGGTASQGKIADYEFYFKSITKDEVVLQGVKNGNIMVLKKATQEEEDFYRSGGIKKIIDEATVAMNGKFLRIEDGSKQTPGAIDFTTKTASIIEIGANNQTISQNVSFVFSADADGLDLLTPLVYSGKSYTKIYWDPVNKEFYLLDGTNRYIFKASDTPTILNFTPPFYEMFGQDKHKIMKANPAKVPQAGKFNNEILSQDLATVAAAGRTYTYFSFDLVPNPSVGADITLSVRTASSTYFIGSYYYKIIWVDQSNGIFKLQFVGNAGSYAASTLSYSAALRNYLVTHTFKAAYLAISRSDNLPVAGFISMDEPNSFIIGVLGNAVGDLP